MDDAPEPPDRHSATDTVLALAAGPAHWLGTGNQVTTPILATSILHILAVVGVASRIIRRWLVGTDAAAIGDRPAVALTAGAALMIAAPIAVRLFPRLNQIGLPLAPAIALRVTGLAIFVAVAQPLVHGWDALSFWPVMVLVACDVGLTLTVLGRMPQAVPSLGRVLRSPVHLLAAAAIGAAVAILDGEATDVVATVIGFEVLVVGSYLGLTVVGALVSRYGFELERTRRQLLETEHRDHAHWIHDDVLSEIRLSRLRLERGEVAPEELPAELEAIEHRLRIRQLDEVVRSGSATVAEIVQPYLRMANSADVTLARVPSYEVGVWRVGPATGILLKRAFAVPIANAIQAGTSTLAVQVRRSGGFLEVEVEDDAGGFDPDDVHRGRGLDVLGRELEPGGVTVERLASGTRVTCRVPLRRSDGAWRQSANSGLDGPVAGRQAAR